jgi:hypothetical protein
LRANVSGVAIPERYPPAIVAKVLPPSAVDGDDLGIEIDRGEEATATRVNAVEVRIGPVLLQKLDILAHLAQDRTPRPRLAAFRRRELCTRTNRALVDDHVLGTVPECRDASEHLERLLLHESVAGFAGDPNYTVAELDLLIRITAERRERDALDLATVGRR